MSQGSVAERITNGINKLLADGHRVVWWADPEAEFKDAVGELALAGAELISVAEHPALAIKRRIELDDRQTPVVLYESRNAPEPEQDWLLDIRLYAAAFAADATSMLQQDLGLRNTALREHLKSRARFFASKRRTASLAKRIQPDDGEREIDAKIWAVLAGSVSADAFTLLLDLFCDVAKLDAGVAAEESPLWQKLCKYGLEDFAWRLIEVQFGYGEQTPSLARLIPRLFATDLAHGMHAELPAGLAGLVLPENRKATVAVFLSQWRDSSTRQSLYDDLSDRVADELNIRMQLSGLSPQELGSCVTFVDLERFVANGLRDWLLGNHARGVTADIRRIAHERMAGFWANTRYPDSEVGRRSLWRSYYQAVMAATDLFAAIDDSKRHFTHVSAKDAYDAYTQTLYRVDQLYRQYHEEADKVSRRYPDAMSTLDDEVEARYLKGYLSRLSAHWDDHLNNGLLSDWVVPGVANQHNFYRDVVEPYVADGDTRRMFVIISDAMRYEVAEELKGLINGRERVQAELGSQLGVLPSYTRLGMASLLPHEQLSYTDKGAVLVDGASSDGLENRSRILAGVDGIALRAETLANMGKQALREQVKPYRVVYIYHNTIDAVGDAAATESQTWVACRRAIDELSDLVGRLVNNVSATAITITADHGFLYRETPLEPVDKSAVGGKPAGTVVAKKRYLVGHDLGEAEDAFHGKTSVTAGTACATEFRVPLGTGRFHFVGGSRFVHGGACLQEVVVPVIRIRQKYGRSTEATRVGKAGVNVLGQQHRITTNRHVFTLLQTEAVGERVLPCSVNVGLVNQSGTAVSSSEFVRLDRTAEELDQRQFKVAVSLLAQAVNKSDQHYLILSDADSGVELQRIAVRIDLAIENDFDF